MPLTKRAVSPVLVSQHRLPSGGSARQLDELECVSNGTLANLVRQMSSLSRHAENIFGELYHEAMKLDHKTATFATRVDRIAGKVTQLDSAVEEVSLQDLHLRKPFKSSALIDQQSLSRQTMPAAMAECYAGCDRPPELDKLNPYRTDGKQGLKFYTDPDYFFELWRQEMLKDGDQARKTKHLQNQKAPEKRQKTKHKAPPSENGQSINKSAKRLVGNVTYDPMFKNPTKPVVAMQQKAPNNLQRPVATDPNQYQNGRLQNGHVVHNGEQQRRPIDNGADLVYASTPNYRPINIRRTDYSTLGPASSLTSPDGVPRQDSLQQASPSSEHSKSSSTGSRPHRPPPAPPTDNDVINNNSTSATFDDLYTRVVKQTRDITLSPPPPPVHLDNGGGIANRPLSPDLPPPPPPLFSSDELSTSLLGIGASTDFTPLPPPVAPPPAPPPPPPTMSGGMVMSSQWVAQPQRVAPPAPPQPQQSLSNFKVVKSPSGQQVQHEQHSAGAMHNAAANKVAVPDTRSDLLRAIRDGIQLKRVDRLEERQREQAAINSGHHDVAAILRKRMEDVMGPDEPSDDEPDADGSGSDFNDDWDD